MNHQRVTRLATGHQAPFGYSVAVAFRADWTHSQKRRRSEGLTLKHAEMLGDLIMRGTGHYVRFGS